MDETLDILLIEDNPADARLIQVMLAEGGISSDVCLYERLGDGLEYLDAGTSDIILLDLTLPDSSGKATLDLLLSKTSEIPIIILTGLNDENLAIELVKGGAQDYLVKGHFDTHILKRAIYYAIERKKGSIALWESKEKYRTLVENLNDIVFQIDLSGNMIYLNEIGRKAIEIGSDLSIGRWEDLIHPDDREKVMKAYQHLGETGIPFQNLEFRCIARRGKGKVFWVINNASPLRNEREEIIGIEGIAHDITQLKEAERQIQSQNRQLSIINQIIRLANSSLGLDEMLEIILEITVDMLDFDLGWIYLKRPDGVTAELVSHQGIPLSFVEERKILKIRDYPYNVVFFAGQPRIVENQPGQPPGVFDSRLLEEVDAVSYMAVPLMAETAVVGALFVGKRVGYAFFGKEIATLEAIGKEIGGTILRGMLQDQLEEAYEETSCYLDILAHDIKDANNELIRCSKIIREMLHGPAEVYVDKQLVAIQQISEIITNVSTLRRISDEQLKSYPVSLDSVIRTVMERFPDATIHYTDTGLSVYADELISEIFVNLIGNSVMYGGPNVEVWIRTEQTEGTVLVSVEDSGPGIPPQNRVNIFSWFQPNSPKASGRGLGLYVTNLLVNRYSGKIKVDDRIAGNPASGLAIRFTLPICEE